MEVKKSEPKTPLSYLLISDNLSLEPLETFNGDVLNQGVHLLGRIFVLVSATAHSNSHSGGQVLDTLGPDELVQVRVNSHVLSQHNLLDELLNSAESSGGSLLEGLLEGHLSQMDGGVSGDGFQTFLGGLSTLSSSCHRNEGLKRLGRLIYDQTDNKAQQYYKTSDFSRTNQKGSKESHTHVDDHKHGY
jgi:hypothetical protein